MVMCRPETESAVVGRGVGRSCSPSLVDSVAEEDRLVDKLDVESTSDAVLLLALVGATTVSAWVPLLTAVVGVGDSGSHFVGVGGGGGVATEGGWVAVLLVLLVASELVPMLVLVLMDDGARRVGVTNGVVSVVDSSGLHVWHVPGHCVFMYCQAGTSQYCFFSLHQLLSDIPLHCWGVDGCVAVVVHVAVHLTVVGVVRVEGTVASVGLDGRPVHFREYSYFSVASPSFISVVVDPVVGRRAAVVAMSKSEYVVRMPMN